MDRVSVSLSLFQFGLASPFHPAFPYPRFRPLALENSSAGSHGVSKEVEVVHRGRGRAVGGRAGISPGLDDNHQPAAD